MHWATPCTHGTPCCFAKAPTYIANTPATCNLTSLPACNEDTVESVRPCKRLASPRLALLSILPPPSCFRSNTAGLLSVYAGLTVRPDWRFGRVRRGLRDVELEMREREMFRWFSREENRRKFRWMQWHETVVEWKWLCMKEWMEDFFLFLEKLEKISLRRIRNDFTRVWLKIPYVSLYITKENLLNIKLYNFLSL